MLSHALRDGGPADPDVKYGIEAMLRTVSLVPEVPAQDRLGDLWGGHECAGRNSLRPAPSFS